MRELAPRSEKGLSARRVVGLPWEDAGIPQRTARRMLAFAMAGVQNGHVAVLGVRYIDRLIATSRRMTAGAIEFARADPHLMPWQKTPEEIAAGEWEDRWRLCASRDRRHPRAQPRGTGAQRLRRRDDPTRRGGGLGKDRGPGTRGWAPLSSRSPLHSHLSRCALMA